MQAAERRQKKTELKREAILRSAAAAFRRKGYHGTSMEDISEALLMTKGSLYYYFQDKEAILFACHDFSLDKVLATLKQDPEASASQRLARMIEALVHVIIDELGGSALALDFTALSPELLARIIAKRDQFDRGMRAVIQQGVKSGEFRKVDVKLASFAVLGAINWISKWFRPEGEQTAHDIARTYSDLLVSALKAGELPAAPRRK
ncbi:MAG: TetR family transcriptional regulator [Planctomycetes bacterium]|nr:TetR family transcriptional regulator [Planctomycetota bacterium]